MEVAFCAECDHVRDGLNHGPGSVSNAEKWANHGRDGQGDLRGKFSVIPQVRTKSVQYVHGIRYGVGAE